jgi:hypothetical protein
LRYFAHKSRMHARHSILILTFAQKFKLPQTLANLRIDKGFLCPNQRQWLAAKLLFRGMNFNSNRAALFIERALNAIKSIPLGVF